LALLDFKTQRFHIFISSTIEGLKRERRTIKVALEKTYPQFHVYLSEDWGSDSCSPEEACLKLAKDCDLFILLLGKRYGNPPNGYSVSVTEMEFEKAQESDPKKIKAYLKTTQFFERKQVEFIKRARDFRSGLICPEFRTLVELKELVIRDVIDYFVSPKFIDSRLSQSYSPTFLKEFNFTQSKDQRFLSQTDYSHPKGLQLPDPVKQQRTYLHNVIHKKTPSKLAKRLIANLSAGDLLTLALIAEGNFLTRKEYLQIFFPEIKWRGFIQRMRRRGLIVSEASHVKVAENVKKQLEQDERLTQKTHEAWVSVLEPKAGYPDLALVLCLHLVELKQWPEIIEHAHSMMLAVEDRFTAELFYNIIAQLRASRVYRKVSSHNRILLLDAIGIFQIHEVNYSDALSTFNSMLFISRRAKDKWGIGQALLHRGVAWTHIGDDWRAQLSYQQAADWARKENDEFLLGRILHNLSQCQMALDPQLAAKTLEESMLLKKNTGDQEGLFAVYTGRGILAGQAGNNKEALRWFRQAERVAQKFENKYGLANALHNQAISLSQLGKSEAAISRSSQARETAESLERKDLIILTTQGEAGHRFKAQDYTTALPLFLKLHVLKKKIGDIQGSIVALSDASIIELYLKHYDAARSQIHKYQTLATAMY